MTNISATIRGRESIGNRHKIFLEFDITIDPDAPEDHAGVGRVAVNTVTNALIKALNQEKSNRNGG